MLGIEPEKTIQDLVTAPGELDTEKLAGYITRHSSGLDVLPAPIRPEDAELVTEAKLARLIEVAKESYDLIVVDTSPFFHGPMLATLDQTDDLLLVCGLDVPTIKNVRLSLQTLELLSFPPERVRVVLNRANSNVGMKKGEVEAALEAKIRFEVPSDRAVPLAVNRGEPAVPRERLVGLRRACGDIARFRRRRRPSERRASALPPGRRSSSWAGSTTKHQEPERSADRAEGAADARRANRRSAIASAAAGALGGGPVRRAEDACPSRLHRQARPAALHHRDEREPLRARPARGHRAAGARPHPAHARGARAPHRPRDHRRHPRLRAAGAAAPGRHRDRGHGQQLRPDLHRARGQARAVRRPSPTTPTCSGSSTRSSRRSAGASTRPRRWSTRAFRTAAA